MMKYCKCCMRDEYCPGEGPDKSKKKKSICFVAFSQSIVQEIFYFVSDIWKYL